MDAAMLNAHASSARAPLSASSAFAPPPPWHLRGSAVAMPAVGSGQGLHLLALVHYESSPVGPYEELGCITLTARGPSVVQMLVTSEASKVGGRDGWGFPKEVAPMQWQRHQTRAGLRLRFRAGSRQWWIRPWGAAFSLSIRGWCVQEQGGAPVRVPVQLQGRAHLAWQGRRMALWLKEFSMTVASPAPRR